jgi:hypothetical protein
MDARSWTRNGRARTISAAMDDRLRQILRERFGLADFRGTSGG